VVGRGVGVEESSDCPVQAGAPIEGGGIQNPILKPFQTTSGCGGFT